MSYFNEKYLKKAFMLEFRISDQVKGAIAFSLPPQREDYRTTQRINATKVFGGIIYDDYGNDSIKITLSGTTANNRPRLVYTSTTNTDVLTGEEEIFKIDEMIKEFGKNENLQNKTVFLYNLDSELKSPLYWQVLIEDFHISRSKDKPKCYDYTLTCTALPEKVNKKNFLANMKNATNNSDLANISDAAAIEASIKNSCTKIKEANKTLNEGISGYKEYYNSIKKSITDLENGVNDFFKAINGYAEEAVNFIQETESLGDFIINKSAKIVSDPFTNILSTSTELTSAAKNAFNFVCNLPDKLTNVYSKTTGQLAEDVTRAVVSTIKSIMTESNSVNATLVKNLSDETFAVIPGENGADDIIVKVYKGESSTVTDGDTWATLAYKYLGDPGAAAFLAAYNKNINLISGEEINIPSLIKPSNNDNEVYRKDYDSSPYGVDIECNDSGEIELDDSGNFITVDGVENLKQAITNLLSTDMSARIKLMTYGLNINLGSPYLATSYITAAIKQAVLSDPRVKTVDSIKVKGIGDKLYIEIVYTDIFNSTGIYGGSL